MSFILQIIKGLDVETHTNIVNIQSYQIKYEHNFFK